MTRRALAARVAAQTGRCFRVLATLLAAAATVALLSPSVNAASAAHSASSAARQARTATVESTLPTVTIQAEQKLKRQIDRFVASVIVQSPGEALARWVKPVCPLVTGQPREFDEFIEARIEQFARAAHAPLAGKHCTANLFVFAIYQPDLLLKKLWARYPAMYSTRNGLGRVRHFLHSRLPVHVWYNVALHCANPGTAPIGVQDRFAVNGYGSAEYCTGGTRLSYASLNATRSAFIVVDMNRMRKVTTRQLADYVAMVGLADIRANADAGSAPTILRLFSHPEHPPQASSAWDRALLYSLYNTSQASVMQVSDMVSTMFERITRQPNAGHIASPSSRSASPAWVNEVLPQRDASAVYWYRVDAERGSAIAQYGLGVLYANGQGVRQSYIKSAQWYRKAATQGSADAQSSLGSAYAKGQGVSQDYHKAAHWYRKAAQQGDAVAQYNLGILYANGHGVPRNYVTAAEWYRKAAQQGNADAQSSLGVAYANGQGVQRNDVEAARWIRKAAEQGDADAQYNLGVLYQSGRGVPRDSVAAYEWWILANADSSSKATAGLSRKKMTAAASQLSASQIARARREASEWLAAHRLPRHRILSHGF